MFCLIYSCNKPNSTFHPLQKQQTKQRIAACTRSEWPHALVAKCPLDISDTGALADVASRTN